MKSFKFRSNLYKEKKALNETQMVELHSVEYDKKVTLQSVLNAEKAKVKDRFRFGKNINIEINPQDQTVALMDENEKFKSFYPIICRLQAIVRTVLLRKRLYEEQDRILKQYHAYNLLYRCDSYKLTELRAGITRLPCSFLIYASFHC
jgi:hypothetical protein